MALKARLFYSDKLKTGTISRLSEKQSHYTKTVSYTHLRAHETV